MAETKTKQTDDDVGAFLAGVEDPRKRADSHTLVALMSEVTGEPPKLWGNIVSFGELDDGELLLLTQAGIQRIG